MDSANSPYFQKRENGTSGEKLSRLGLFFVQKLDFQ